MWLRQLLALHPCSEIGEFQGLVGNFIELVDGLAKRTEEEKIGAIGARNHLKSVAKEREAQKQQLKALIAEKKLQLERYQSRTNLDAPPSDWDSILGSCGQPYNF